VVIESGNPRGGKVVDEVGSYCPYVKGKTLKLDLARLKSWQDKGAKPSEAVQKLIKKASKGSEQVSSGKTQMSKAPVVEKAAVDTPVSGSGEAGEG
jgi:small subunit ribosomal protein S16